MGWIELLPIRILHNVACYPPCRTAADPKVEVSRHIALREGVFHFAAPDLLLPRNQPRKSTECFRLIFDPFFDKNNRAIIDLAASRSWLIPKCDAASQKSQTIFASKCDSKVSTGKVANLNDPFVAALAATSIDDESQAALQGRAVSGDKNAEAIWNFVRFPSLPVAIAGFETSSQESSFEEQKAYEAPDVEPKEVSRFLNKLDPPYEQHKFSRSWFSKQTKEGNAEAAYKALRDWMRQRDYYVVDGELLLEMVPFAEEFDGREEGFKCLCMAATQSYAWSRFAYSPKEREKIWSLLKQRYPDKWLEYVYRTCSTSMYGTPLRKMTYVPASPGVDFLVQFGQLAPAEALVEADWGFIEELMANLRIPSVDWFHSSRTALDSLIARAFWIGPLVRERASNELAKLLLKAETEAATLEALISGLSSEKLESRTVIWLLPMVRARRKGWNAPIDTIKRAVQTPSVLSESLLAEL